MTERAGAVIIGGGVVGCAIAAELAGAGFPDVVLLEKAAQLGDAQSGRNSGVIHAGIYYPTGSLKARLCVASNALTYHFCARHGVAAQAVGKLVVASSDDQLSGLQEVHERAVANGVPGVRMLDAAEVCRHEPNIHVVAALFCPSTGIVDAAGLTNTLASLARRGGAQVLCDFEVDAIEPLSAGGFRVHGRRGQGERAQAEDFDADVVINAAGLHSDQVARMVDPDFGPRIEPLRGEYYRFNRRSRPEIHLHGANIYPVPTWIDIGEERLKMVGVHLTPTFELDRSGRWQLGDTVVVGPEFVRVDDPENYDRGRKPRELFYERAAAMMPSLRPDDLSVAYTGIMASRTGGSDFMIERAPGQPDFLQLVGIDSPGLTCALAIGQHVRGLLAS